MASSLPENQDLKSILEHARGQFQYHAGQRLNGIRYFFIAYAIFVTAYVGTMGKFYAPDYAQLTLAILAFIVTLGFWGLDVRNVQLVHINEDALKEIEQLVAARYELQKFKMTEACDARRYSILKYSVIVNLLFLVIALITFAAVVFDLLHVFCAK